MAKSALRSVRAITTANAATANGGYRNMRPREAALELLRADGRHLVSRRIKAIVRTLTNQGGGEDALSEVKKQLVRRFAATVVLTERLEADLASGTAIDIGEHTLLTSTLIRLANVLGKERVAKVINPPPDLQQYLRHHRRPAIIEVEAD
jgi:hypothetical protein